MIDISNAFSILYKGIDPEMNKYGFTASAPDALQKGETPLFTRDKSSYLEYKGDKGTVRILFNENKFRFLSGDADASSIDDSDFKLASSYLFIPDEYDEKDVRSIVNEIAENLYETYSKKAMAKKQASDIKAQATVTKSQVKSGSLLYDSATLAVRLSAIYPELKDYYKDNIAEYGEFLCEEFFNDKAAPLIINTIKQNDQQKMKKIFSVLNEIYNDGSNEVQDVIAVTILGKLNNDTELMHRILPYLGETMLEPVMLVNKYLSKSKSARMRLENPPKYKPKKKKKSGGLMSMLMGGGQGGNMPM